MPDDQTVTIPAGEDVASLLASQDTGGESQHQEPANTEVDSNAPSDSSNGQQRKPSYYVKQRELERTVKSMQDKLDFLVDRFNQPAAQQPQNQVDYNKEIWNRPIEVIQEISRKIAQETLNSGVPQALNQHEYKRTLQEAKELIFNDNDVKKDPDGNEKIAQIIESNGLNIIGEKNPLQAAKAALYIYRLENGIKSQRNQNAPSKGQLSSVSSATMQSNSNKPVNIGDLENLKSKLADAYSNGDVELVEKLKQEFEAMKLRVSQQR